MFANNTIQEVESTHHEQLPRNELDPLIQRGKKVLTKKEARMARAQFLALGWALFVIGWTDGSTGPLLPRIQYVYDVGCRFPLIIFNLSSLAILQIGFGTVSWVFVLQCTVSDRYWVVVITTLHHCQGVVVGALLNMPLNDRLGLGNVSFYFILTRFKLTLYN